MKVGLKSVSNITDHTWKQLAERVRRIVNFVCIIPSPKPALLSINRKFHSLRHFPLLEKQKKLKETTGRVTSFSSLSEHCTNDLLCFHPTQRRAEPRQPETTRNKEEGQGLPVSTTQQEWLWFSVSSSAENPRNFAMTKPSASIVIEQPLKILVLITPPGTTLADSNFLSPVFPLSSNRDAPANDTLRPRIHTGCQPQYFRLGMCKTPSQTPAAAQVSILHQWKAVYYVLL